VKLEKEPLISVVIPVKNGAPWLKACMDGLLQQTLFPQTEIIVVDSGSTDDSLSILKHYPVRVLQIPPQEFNHGLTRNYALQYCKGAYVVMTVQDAVPVDSNWLELLYSGFTMDENVAGVCGQQVVPHVKEANPIYWFRPVSAPVPYLYKFSGKESFESLTPLEQKNCCGWDNVTAMYRKSVLDIMPFRKTTYGEDCVWAREALINGYAIVYQPAARVYHFHVENADYSFKRAFTTMYLRYRQFGYLYPRPNKTIREKLSLIKTLWRSLPFRPGAIAYWYQQELSNFKALQRAHTVFMEALDEGEAKLELVHEKYCGKPPVPLQKRNSVQYERASG
jgi:rhamnosyltransferase